MMILRIISLGWKNVWRNPARSGVVIIAVILGLWAGVFISAFFNSMAQAYLKNSLDLTIGHLQISHPAFEDQFNPIYSIAEPRELRRNIQQQEGVQKVTLESLSTGLAQSAVNGYGVTIHGIDTASGSTLPAAAEYMEEGRFLDGRMRNPVVIGKALAERLELEARSRLVLSFQDREGNITAGAFRIVGVFDTFNDGYDRNNVYVVDSDLNRLLGEEGMVHKITIQLDDFTKAGAMAERLQEQYPDLQVSSWGAIAPELQYVHDTMDISLYVIMVIIVIALVFSIINTMLMAVLERSRELGMLMAIGMNKARLFGMILSETFFLTMAGTPLGLLLSWGTVTVLGKTGIDLGAFAQGLNAYGLSTVIYPDLSGSYYLNITLLVGAAAILSSLYPSWKTLKLKPVEAIRKI